MISYFALIHPRCFFSTEKEEFLFHMGLKTEWTEFECFIWNVLLRHYVNEFIRIINRNYLTETFQAYRKNYSMDAVKSKVYEFVYLQLEKES